METSMSKRNKRGNDKKRKHNRPGKPWIPTQRVRVSDATKGRIVALWCHLSRQKKRSYPFHFVAFYGDLTLYCQGLVNARDAVDAWKVAVFKLRDSAKYPEYPGEMGEEEVAQLIAFEKLIDWDDTFKSNLLGEALAFAENQLSLVGGQHFKSSPTTKLTNSIFDELSTKLSAKDEAGDPSPSCDRPDPHPLAR